MPIPPKKKRFFAKLFFMLVNCYGEQILFERLREFHNKLLSLLSRLDENSLLIFLKISFLIIYLNLLETCCFMFISPWKELLLLHIICNLLCYASAILRFNDRFCSLNQARNWEMVPQIKHKNEVWEETVFNVSPPLIRHFFACSPGSLPWDEYSAKRMVKLKTLTTSGNRSSNFLDRPREGCHRLLCWQIKG